jgi:uncharacterized protein involved in exopolysaccharide biosynthesis
MWLLITVPIILAVLVFFLTKNEKKIYASKARVYTAFASGSSIELESRLDFKATNIEYDNLINLIKSKTTVEEVSLKLFTQHLLLDKADPKFISAEKYQKLMAIVPEEVKALVVQGDMQKTYDNFLSYKQSSADNFINELLNLKHPDYSYEELVKRISIKRILSSDFIDIEFQSEDAAICQHTLTLLTDTFIRLNAEIKADQSDVVVHYFEGQLNRTSERLTIAEKELLNFNRENLIMNYYEQTKLIAGRREDFELRYQEVQQNYSASEAVIAQLEKKISTHDKKLLQNNKILELRENIGDINYKIAMKSINIENDSVKIKDNYNEVYKLNQKLNLAKKQINQAVDTVFVIDHNSNGIASSKILNDWLAQSITFEGSKAELKILDIKRIEFDDLYKRYAPLGAILKKLERKIGIEEKEYLSLLQSLGLAKLKQQNGQLKSNIQITEAAFFPLNPEPSKRIILVIVAGLAGFIIIVFTLLALEFLDGNINTAERAKDRIKLSVSSIFPVINPKDKVVDYGFLQNKAINAISRNIILNQFKKEDKKEPILNMLFSTQEKEGKTFICKQLISKLTELDYNVLHITYDTENLDISHDCYHKMQYPISDKLYKISALHEFSPNGLIENYASYDFIIFEIPSIIKNPFPVMLVASMDFTFLVTRANRAWSDADKNALNLFKKATSGPEPTIILNGVKVNEMETVVGELPKKRSFLRQWIKQIVRLRFFTKKTVI